MHRVLYAADFSTSNRNTFKQACTIAQAWKAKLLIAHVDNSSSDAANDHAASKQKLAKITPTDIAIDYQHILRTGDLSDVLLDIENEYDVDLIVVGTHGRKGIKRLFAGSIAETVIRSARCPVLTLRHVDHALKLHGSDSTYRPKFLVPMDFSVHSYVSLDFAASIAAAMNGRMTILHVDDSTDDSTEKVREGLAEWSDHRKLLWEQLTKVEPPNPGIEFTHELLNSPASQHITQYANLKQFDYIVLGTHGRTGVGRALMGSVAEHVVRNADCPVITVKPSNKLNPDVHQAKLSHQPPV